MLEELKGNIAKLISLYEAERARSTSLALALEQSRSDGEAYRKQIIDLERQIENLRIAGAFRAAGDSTPEARELIDRLIKELDKCILMLEKD